MLVQILGDTGSERTGWVQVLSVTATESVTSTRLLWSSFAAPPPPQPYQLLGTEEPFWAHLSPEDAGDEPMAFVVSCRKVASGRKRSYCYLGSIEEIGHGKICLTDEAWIKPHGEPKKKKNLVVTG